MMKAIDSYSEYDIGFLMFFYSGMIYGDYMKRIREQW